METTHCEQDSSWVCQSKTALERISSLVTARHILDPDWAFCPPSPQKVFLRFNKTNYDPEKDQTGVEYVPLELVINGRPVYKVSDDDRVDAAIVQLNLPALPQSKYDYLPIDR